VLTRIRFAFAFRVRSELSHDAAAARGGADVSSYGGVLAAFRDSAAGADACAEAAAAAAAAAAARRRAAGEASGDEDEDEEEEEEEDPEERAAREALQVTRISLGLPPSARLAARGPGSAAVPLPPHVPAPRVPEGEDDELISAAERGDETTELVPFDKEEEERDRWDCDTIVSTYSNLENHPSIIDDGAPRGRSRRGAGSRAGSDAAGGAAGAPALIRLGKSGMPVDFVPTRAKKTEGGGGAAGGDGGGGSDGESSYDSEEDGGGEGLGAAWRAQTRRKGESAEEKKARKAAVKEGRREARANKKETKSMFKSAAVRATPQTGALPRGASIMPIL
jgi:protein LTV1